MRWVLLVLALTGCATARIVSTPRAGAQDLPPIEAYADAPPRHLSNEMGITIKLGRQ